jgi:hypothetical protein
VGGPSKFFRPLTRKPLTAWTRFAGAGGPHKGIQSIDVATYVRLHTDIDLDGLYDLLEMQEVHQSWKHAATANVRESAHGV